MARYIDASCKLCRRERQKLFLKGTKCFSEKCPLDRRSYPPGQHGQSRRQKVSEYGIQLREKQKIRRLYGLAEMQFRNYFEKALRQTGKTGELLVKALERRFDNVVYRLGFAKSRDEARQVVRHGHITVNDRRVDIPSYRVRPGEVVAVAAKSRELLVIKTALIASEKIEVPGWLEVDIEKLQGKILSLPSREQIDAPVRAQLIVELYSK